MELPMRLFREVELLVLQNLSIMHSHLWPQERVLELLDNQEEAIPSSYKRFKLITCHLWNITHKDKILCSYRMVTTISTEIYLVEVKQS